MKLLAQAERLPKSCGIYQFLNEKGKILYIGKAKNIHRRVLQYFTGHDGRQMVSTLLRLAKQIDITITENEKEALLLEAFLIHKHRPRFNVQLLNGGQFLYIQIDKNKPWPMVSLTRFPSKTAKVFGPLPSARKARKTFSFIERRFPLRTCSDNELKRRKRPCLLFQMHRCIGPCVAKCTTEEYDQYVNDVELFLSGKNARLIKKVQERMKELAGQHKFEAAAEQRDLMFALSETLTKQRVAGFADKDCDFWGWYRAGDRGVITILPMREGNLHEAVNVHFSEDLENDDAELLSTLLMNWYCETMEMPDCIFTPLSPLSSDTIEQALSEKKGKRVRLFSPQKGDKKKLVQLAQNNAKVAFQRSVSQQLLIQNKLVQLQKICQLPRLPRRIECFDNSNLQGRSPVASMVCFIDGKPSKSNYRKFQIKTVVGPDDYASMEEVLQRRFLRSLNDDNWSRPDLLIVDGGKGQLNIALSVLAELGIGDVSVIGISKPRTEHAKGDLSATDKIVLPNIKEPIRLRKNDPVLLLLQQIRDESHRTALTYHRKKRSKETKKTGLNSVSGIGPEKQKRLLKHFGSFKAIRAASIEELTAVKGISLQLACRLKEQK